MAGLDRTRRRRAARPRCAPLPSKATASSRIRRAPRAAACASRAWHRLKRIGLGRARRDDRRRAVEAESCRAAWHGRRSSPGRPARWRSAYSSAQFARADIAGCEIDGVARDEPAVELEFRDEIAQARDRAKAAAIDVGCGLESVERGEIAQRQVDLPLQHRGAGGRAAKTLALAVDHHDLVAERASDARPRARR